MKSVKDLRVVFIVASTLVLVGCALVAPSSQAKKSAFVDVSWLNNTSALAEDSGNNQKHATAGLFSPSGTGKTLGNALGTPASAGSSNKTTSSKNTAGTNTKDTAKTSTAGTTTVAKQSQQKSTSTAAPSTSAALAFSSSYVTLPQISATSDGSTFITVSATSGTITQPIASGYQKVAILETTGTPPSSEIFRSQWTFKLVRNTDTASGADGFTFTSTTSAGNTISGHVSVNIIPTPSFTVTKGPLTKVANADGTVTYTAHLILNPSAYFGNPQLHMCQLSGRYCGVSNDFTYSGNNDLTMSQTITPFPSGSIHAYFDISILIDGWYTQGGGTFSWHEDY